MNSAEEKVKELEKNFPIYRDSHIKNITHLMIERTEHKAEIREYQAQGDSVGVAEFQKLLKTVEDTLRREKEMMEYDRVPTLQDYNYRHKQYQSFAQKIKGLINMGKLCFHGTNIVATKHILESGSISSGISRGDYGTSFDTAGMISATDVKNVDVSVGTYMNLVDNMYQPAGCLFVVRPADDNDYKNAVERMSIKNVDFKHHPERLVAIVTTPENIERVSGWAKESGLAPTKVMSFERFISKYPPLRRDRAFERETMRLETT